MRAKSYAKIAIWTITALVTAFAAATHIACGTQGDIIGGTTAWPVSGTKPWAKLDLGDGVLALLAPEGEVYLEPCLIKALGHHWIYFERRVVEAREDGLDYATHSEILVAKGRNAFDYEIEYDGLPVLYPTQDWEGEFVGAPTILQREDNSLVMWYAGGVAAGIGRAISHDGGETWEKDDGPVMVADQKWERGFVGAPSVIYHNHLFRMYYSGGEVTETSTGQFAGRLIGYADSPDGIHWTKRDHLGNNSKDDGNNVFYIMGPTQFWEGADEVNPDPYIGGVNSPAALMTNQAGRNVLLLYYGGNLVGDPILHEMSVGVAGAYDYNTFTKAPIIEMNPVVNQNFDLNLWGISEYLGYSEYSPSVIQVTFDLFLMAFAQTDPLAELTGGSRGIGLAQNPPPRDAAAGG